MMKPPFFIIGCERSGTTLLRWMLNTHPDLAVPNEAERFSYMLEETNLWRVQWNRQQALAMLKKFIDHEKIQNWNIQFNPDVEEFLPIKNSYRFSDVIACVYQYFAFKTKKKRWGDKTPHNTFELVPIIKSFPGVQIIHIVRDGRDVFLSCKARWGKEDPRRNDIGHGAKKWQGWVWSAYMVGEYLPSSQYLCIKYEDLVSDPVMTLGKVCQYLGITYSADMLHYYENKNNFGPDPLVHTRSLYQPPDPSHSYKWKTKMKEPEVMQFDRIAGNVLYKYGYEVQNKYLLKSKIGYHIQSIKDYLKIKLLNSNCVSKMS